MLQALIDILGLIAGKDFLVISDTASHAGLNCYLITPLADTVFESVTVGDSNMVTAKGLATVTIPIGMPLPFGNNLCTEIKLTSGSAIAYLKK